VDADPGLDRAEAEAEEMTLELRGSKRLPERFRALPAVTAEMAAALSDTAALSFAR
jgi:hypothetical protein|tara:strand:- start:18213 stop:18380 length:168 start_codon:yes stop_codon:yes gene_type:complete